MRIVRGDAPRFDTADEPGKPLTRLEGDELQSLFTAFFGYMQVNAKPGDDPDDQVQDACKYAYAQVFGMEAHDRAMAAIDAGDLEGNEDARRLRLFLKGVVEWWQRVDRRREAEG